MRLQTKLHRNWRGFWKLVHSVVDTGHPFLVHLVPIRRCNIECGYCNEYDKVSQPVPLDVMLQRVDQLAALGTSSIAFSGGEPLLHPQLDDIIRAIRGHGMMAALITNGYFLSPARIRSLNDAGLDFCQISIDNVEPDDISKKSLRLLDKKLQWLAEFAEFDVNINSVLGGGVRNPEDAQVITARARELGFSTSLGIIHGSDGHLRPLDTRSRQIFDEVTRDLKDTDSVFKNLYSSIHGFQQNLVEGKPNTWYCRAGARYLYVCEDGLVHWCSQQRGTPGIPLAQYTIENIRTEYMRPKSCAPYCTIGCVHRVSPLDSWRNPQTDRVPETPGLRMA
ncbi:MAG: radical SAM protein [Vicinamibacterales bacterium]